MRVHLSECDTRELPIEMTMRSASPERTRKIALTLTIRVDSHLLCEKKGSTR